MPSVLHDARSSGFLVSFARLLPRKSVLTYFTTVWTLRTPRRPPKQEPDAPENQQRQLREVRDETAAPRLAVRF